MKPVRSLLFAPATRPEIATKAMSSGADSVIVDLEDSVPLHRKEEARGFVRALEPGDLPVFVRINGPESQHFWDDVVASVRQGVAGLIIPKAEHASTLLSLDGAVTALERAAGIDAGSIEVLPFIETSLGIVNIRDIVVQPRVASIIVGTSEQGDLVADLGCQWSPDGFGMLTIRSLCLVAARAAGIRTPIDGVFMDLSDGEALRQECLLALRLGFRAKAVIHPRQIPIVHEVFTPSPEEVERQRAVIEAFDTALAEGRAVVGANGKMVDYATVRAARSVVERAEYAAAMDARR